MNGNDAIEAIRRWLKTNGFPDGGEYDLDMRRATYANGETLDVVDLYRARIGHRGKVKRGRKVGRFTFRDGRLTASCDDLHCRECHAPLDELYPTTTVH